MKRQLTAFEVQDVLRKLELYLNDLKVRWNQENPGGVRSWFTVPRSYILQATTFIVGIIDELITFVEPVIPEGSDKKAAVLAVVGKLFDYIAVQAFPFWLKPFAGTIKAIVVGIIISHLIDFIVAKYNSGYWSMKQEATNGTTDQVA
jgi:hypothetical protein